MSLDPAYLVTDTHTREGRGIDSVSDKSGSRSFEEARCAHTACRQSTLVHRATTVDELRNSAASDRQRCSTALWPAGVRSKHRYLGRAFPPRCAYSRVLRSVRRWAFDSPVSFVSKWIGPIGRGAVSRWGAKDSRKWIVNVFVLLFSWPIFMKREGNIVLSYRSCNKERESYRNE